MKKIFLVLIILILIFTAFYLYHQQSPITNPALKPSPETQLSPVLDKLESIIINSQTYYFSYIVIDDLTNLKLYPNFKDRLNSLELVEKYHCSVLVNGGFYSEDSKPLGWLVSNGQKLSSPISSQLFNGYLSIFNSKASITSIVPDNVTTGLQTGPLLIQDQKPLLLKIKHDETRRRLVGALTQSNQLLFIVVILKDSLFSGPMLTDLPEVVKVISNNLNLSVTQAINLDGGSASTFYTSKVHLKEFSPIGSFFCLP
jgi:exopolysaccharide biosynthesis protein